MKYFLAVDIGASSGRHMLTHMEEDRMVLEEVHRFYNGMTEKNGHKIWDVDTLFEEIKIGMKKCASLGKIPESMGIDTWAVDFVLLDKNGGRIGDAVAYRDARTTGMDEGMPDCCLLYTSFRQLIYREDSILTMRHVSAKKPEC